MKKFLISKKFYAVITVVIIALGFVIFSSTDQPVLADDKVNHSTFNNKVEEILTQINELETKIETLNNENGELKTTITTLKSKVDNLQKTVDKQSSDLIKLNKFYDFTKEVYSPIGAHSDRTTYYGIDYMRGKFIEYFK